MARGINKVILIGNLGNDPDVRYTSGGSPIANVSLATTDSWRDKETGDLQERTEWHRIVFFSRLAEIVSEYLRKGSKIYVEGRLQTRKWQDRDGNDRYTTEIVANEMQMLDSKGASQEYGGSPGPARNRPRRTRPDARTISLPTAMNLLMTIFRSDEFSPRLTLPRVPRHVFDAGPGAKCSTDT